MSDKVVAEVVQETQTSVDRHTDDSKGMVDIGEAVADYVAQRKSENPEWFGETPEEPSAETETTPEETQQEAATEQEAEVAETEPGDEQARSTDSEPESAVLKRVLTKEAKLRKDIESFKAEQKEWKDKLADFEKSKRLASLDPVSFLKSLGFDKDQLIDVAKSAYYESLDDLAPDEYKGQKESLNLRKKVAELEARLEEKQPEPEQSNEALIAYQDNLLEATKTFDEGKYPTVAKVISAYSEQDVAADMWKVAEAYAVQMNGQGMPLTPEQCLERVEARYAELFGKVNSRTEEVTQDKVERKPAGTKSKTLSNKLNTTQPPAEAVEKLPYDEQRRIWQANFQKALRGDG